MKNVKSFIGLFIIIGLIASFLVSIDAFAVELQKQQVSPSQQNLLQEMEFSYAPVTFVCPQTAKLRTTHEVLYFGKGWQPAGEGSVVLEKVFHHISVINGVIDCYYTDPNDGGWRLMLRRNWPPEYICEEHTSQKNTAICTPQKPKKSESGKKPPIR